MTTRRCSATRRAISWRPRARSPTQLRHWRDIHCKDGFGHKLWTQFAELGFTGILIDEADGGLGLGHVETGIVLEEIGRNLTPSPFLITAVAVVEALKGTKLRERWYPGILAGETVAALAVDEGPKHRPEAIAMRAERAGNGFRLSGAKQFVVQGASADVIVVAARAEEGLTLFAVEKAAKGLEIERVRLVDSSIGARMEFRGVEVDADAVIGEVGQGEAVLTRVLNAGRAGAASELVGLGSASMAMTVDYLKTAQAVRTPDRRVPGAPVPRGAPLFGAGDRPRCRAQGAAIARRGRARRGGHGLRRQSQGGPGVGACSAGRRPDARRHRHDRRI